MIRRLKFVITVALAALLSGCATAPPAPSLEAQQALEMFRTLPRVGADGVVAPKVLSRINPVPPDEVRKRVSKLSAKLDAVIDDEGRVVAIAFVEGDRNWGNLFAEAVRKWTFAPATRDGAPIAVIMTLTASYKADGPVHSPMTVPRFATPSGRQ